MEFQTWLNLSSCRRKAIKMAATSVMLDHTTNQGYQHTFFTVLPFLSPKIIKIETSAFHLLLEQSPYFKEIRKRRITKN